MRDEGLRCAIDAVGGIGALARALGLAQPSVSVWTRVPADRVIAVESATSVSRSILRPDLYETKSAAAAETTQLDDVDLARARSYRLLANLLAKPPSQALLNRVGRISGDATPLGMAWIALADAARKTTETEAGEEFFKLFIGVGRGDVLPYASFYLAGFLNERPLAAIRADLQRFGIERQDGIHEPEDAIATVFDVMAGLIDSGYSANSADQDAFFDAHIKPWAARLFADVMIAPSANFYRAVANVGGQWLDLESRAFSIAA